MTRQILPHGGIEPSGVSGDARFLCQIEQSERRVLRVPMHSSVETLGLWERGANARFMRVLEIFQVAHKISSREGTNEPGALRAALTKLDPTQSFKEYA